MLSAGESSVQPLKDAPATGVSSSEAVARHSPAPLSVAWISSASVPVAGSRNPPTANAGWLVSCTTERRRPQLEPRIAGVRAALRGLAAQPQRDPLAAGCEGRDAVAVGVSSAAAEVSAL